MLASSHGVIGCQRSGDFALWRSMKKPASLKAWPGPKGGKSAPERIGDKVKGK